LYICDFFAASKKSAKTNAFPSSHAAGSDHQLTNYATDLKEASKVLAKSFLM